ncbi:XdhC family protein [Haliangium sp.]|uniref:XdhC family protein n=1 Tax=Haliangium sp. TaxID=2663208 RepID=UPI003D0EBF95
MSEAPDTGSAPAPSPNPTDDVLGPAASWARDGHAVALATVISTWGSSPRPAGSQLAVRDDGAFVGSVSGGCVEAAVVQEARAVMTSREPRRLSFGVSNQTAWGVGLACGGKIEVYVAPLATADSGPGELLERLAQVRADKRTAVLAMWLGSGQQRLLPLDDIVADAGDAGAGAGADLPPDLIAAARAAARADRSATRELDGDEVFLRVYSPPLRLIVVGAVHIAQALCPMAALLGFAVTVVDPRGAFATPERFPGVALNGAWPDRALAELGVDHRTAVVTLTHDPKLDEPALIAALGSPAFYIGALGSKKTQASRLTRLRAHGLDDAALARIHGPVGLSIGASSAAEIAVSIAAQIVAALRAPAEVSPPSSTRTETA